jgi:hypothetical protein
MGDMTDRELLDKALDNTRLPRTWENRSTAGVLWMSLALKPDRVVPLQKLIALKTYDDSKIVGDLIYLITQGSEERLHKDLIKALTYELSTRECASQYPELLV